MKRDSSVALWPALLFFALAAGAMLGGADRAVGGVLYALEGGTWSLRHDYFVSTIMHERAQQAAILIHLNVIILALASRWLACLRRWRRGLVYVALAASTAIALVATAKYLLPFPCPSKLENFGGMLPSKSWYSYDEIAMGRGCFPAAHATCGFALLPWYAFARYYNLRGRWVYLVGALAVGSVFGGVQQIRGAHFLSHDLAAVAVCWLSMWVYARLLLQREPGCTAATEASTTRSIR
jgi:membrane-associated PAP2 superfamily phosphatase